MNEGYETLKKIGVQKIHEQTHISSVHIEALLNDGFDDMTKIQFLGFISILEREYGVNLDDLKDKALLHFSQNSENSNEKAKVFLSANKKRNLTPIYITIAVIIFAVFIYMSVDSSNTEVCEVEKVDNSVIESAKNNIVADEKEVAVIELNNSIPEINTTIIEEESIKDPQADNKITSFKIKPTIKVWLGYVDLKNHKKYQKTFEDELELDPSKNWLLAFGHGHIDIEINGIVKKYTIKKNVRFSYIDGELKDINLEEFKSLNKGSRW